MERMVKYLSLCFLALIFLSSLASANIQYYQTKGIDNASNSVYLHTFAGYQKGWNDYIAGGHPLELYLLYNLYPKTWNQLNPAYNITSCNLVIIQSGSLTSAIVIYNKTFLPSESDISMGKYFVKLTDKESFTARITCFYNQNISAPFELPASMEMIEPTLECKACQYYEWALSNKAEIKAENISEHTRSLWGYFVGLIVLNFSLIIIAFWFALIVLVLLAFSLIFAGAVWIYKYLRRLAG